MPGFTGAAPATDEAPETTAAEPKARQDTEGYYFMAPEPVPEVESQPEGALDPHSIARTR